MGANRLIHFVGDARFLRRARAGRNDDVARLQLRDLVDGDLVVAKDAQVDVRIHLAQALHEVVGEGIVVVDEKDHGGIKPPP